MDGGWSFEGVGWGFQGSAGRLGGVWGVVEVGFLKNIKNCSSFA